MTDQWTMRRLAGFVGQGPARAMCLAAETFTGADVHRLGFVQRLAEPDALLDETLAWAASIATLAPLTIAGFKVGLNEAEGIDDWTPTYRAAFEAAWGSDDLQEGLKAFAERRPPGVPGPLTARVPGQRGLLGDALGRAGDEVALGVDEQAADDVADAVAPAGLVGQVEVDLEARRLVRRADVRLPRLRALALGLVLEHRPGRGSPWPPV